MGTSGGSQQQNAGMASTAGPQLPVVALKHISIHHGSQGERHYAGEHFVLPADKARQWAAEGLVRLK